MSFREMQQEKALAQPGCAVFYFYSTQEFLVRDAAQKTRAPPDAGRGRRADAH